MAKAKLNIKKSGNEVVTLKLTTHEAQFITDVFAKISGYPQTSRRRYQQTIFDALSDLGFEYRTDDLSGRIDCGGTYPHG